MSIWWMAVVAGLIAVEKTVPWRGGATYLAAAVLLILGALMLLDPALIPGLTVPAGSSMQPMR
jgi:predicted metal-binding membrane protein